MNKNALLETIVAVVEPFVTTKIDADTDLLEGGLIDSMTMINILLALEQKFEIQISPSDLTFDHFRSCRYLTDALNNRVCAE